MKKILSILLSLAMLLSITAGLNLTAYADDEFFYSGNYEYYINNDGSVTISDYSGSEAFISIPLQIDGKNVTRIGSRAFQDCESIQNFTIPSTVTYIGPWAFADTQFYDDSKNWEDGMLYISDCLIFVDENKRGNCDIKEGTRLIADGAFVRSKNIIAITIPNSLTLGIDEDTFNGFWNCENVTTFAVNGGNPLYSSMDGVLFNKDKTTLIQYPVGSNRSYYTVPDTVITIGKNAFESAINLNGVVISDSVKMISEASFKYCENLASISIGNGVTEIESDAFYDTAYYNDKNNWNNNILYISNYLIHSDGLRSSYEVKDGTRVISENAFSGQNYFFSIVIPTSVISICKYALSDCPMFSDIYYKGTKAEWNNIDKHNNSLNDVAIHCTDGVINEKVTTTQPVPTTSAQPAPAPTQAPTQAPTTVAPTPAEPTTVANIAAPTIATQVEQTTTPQQTAEPTTQTTTKAVAKPKGAKFKKVKGSKKSIALTWAKVKGVKGYQIQLATDKKFKKNKKTVTIKKQKTTKTTVKKLKAKKKYFVRIRTYKTVNGKKIYSSWSKVKTVKTK